MTASSAVRLRVVPESFQLIAALDESGTRPSIPLADRAVLRRGARGFVETPQRGGGVVVGSAGPDGKLDAGDKRAVEVRFLIDVLPAG